MSEPLLRASFRDLLASEARSFEDRKAKGLSLDSHERMIVAVAERLTWLEADHARLVEENRRLYAEWERWQGAAEAANVEAE